MTIVWHYILHNSSDAPLSFQWVSRNRALYEGKHALVTPNNFGTRVVADLANVSGCQG